MRLPILLAVLIFVSLLHFRTRSNSKLIICDFALTHKKSVERVAGSLLEAKPGRYTLLDPVSGEFGVRTPSLDLERFVGEVEVVGKYVCERVPRNPNHLSFGADTDTQVVLYVREIHKKREQPSLRNWIQSKLTLLFGGYPAVLSTSRLIWMGDAQFISKTIREGLSCLGSNGFLGLHSLNVFSLLFVFELLMKMIFAFIPARFLAGFTFQNILLLNRRYLPVFCAGFLGVVSNWEYQIYRFFLVVAVSVLLKNFNLHAARSSRICSTLAVLVLINPEKMFSSAFFVSAFLCIVWGYAGDLVGGKRFLTVNVFLFISPLLFIPWTSYLFGKISPYGPIYSVLCILFWSAVVLPLGYFSSFIFLVLPQCILDFCLPAIERFLSAFYSFAESGLQHACATSHVIPSLNDAELLVVELGLVTALWYVSKIIRRLFNPGAEFD